MRRLIFGSKNMDVQEIPVSNFMNFSMHFWNLMLLAAFGFLPQSLIIAQISIQQARQAGSGQIVTVTGVVTSGPELGTIRYIQDSTAGIAVYSTLVSNWVQGDSVMITGKLTEYFGLLEIAAPITLDTVLKQNVVTPAPKRIQISEMGEGLESQLVTLKKVIFPAGGTQIAAGSSYIIRDGSDSTSAYFRNGSPLGGVTLPSDTVDVTGICSQYTQYQLLLRTDDAWVPFEPDPVTTIFPPSAKGNLRIFPNPVTEDFFSFELPAGFSDFKVEIFDSKGLSLGQKKCSDLSGGKLARITLAGLPKGNLFIRVSNQLIQYHSTILHL